MLDGDYFLDIPGQAFRKERVSWRAVIQLNIIQAFRLIINAMTRAQWPQIHDGMNRLPKTYQP